ENEVLAADLGDIAPEPRREGALGPVAPHLGQARPPMPAGEAPETRKGERFGQVRERDIRAAVTLAGESEDGVGPRPHPSVHRRAEVDAEKGEPRVRDRIDQAADEMAGPGRERVVVAAEGDDPFVSGGARHRGDAVGVETGATDEASADEVAAARPNDPLSPASFDSQDFAPGEDCAAARAD